MEVLSASTVYTGAMALFQIPAGLLAERWSERRLLALGTVVTVAGFIAAGWTGGFASLLGVLLIAGLASGVQHPLSSTLVSRAYETGRRRAAPTTSRATSARSGCPPRGGLVAAVVGWRVLASADRRSRAYGLYCTIGLSASALAPTLYGVVSDMAGVTPTLLLVAALVLVTFGIEITAPGAVTLDRINDLLRNLAQTPLLETEFAPLRAA